MFYHSRPRHKRQATPLIVLSDAAFVIFIITTLGQLIFLAGTGLWLVSRPKAEAAAMRTSAA